MTLLLDSTCKWGHTAVVFLGRLHLAESPEAHHVVTDGRMPFFSWPIASTVCTQTTFSSPIHLLMDKSWFPVLAVVNIAAVNMGVKGSLPQWLHFLRIYNRIAGSYTCSIFNFLSNLHIVSHGGCINPHSHQQCRGFPFLRILTIICLVF